MNITTEHLRLKDIPIGAAITINGSEVRSFRTVSDYGHDTHVAINYDPFEYDATAKGGTSYVNAYASVDVLPGYYAITDR